MFPDFTDNQVQREDNRLIMPHSKRLTPEAADDERDESEASRNSNGSSGNHHNGGENPRIGS